MEIRKIDEAYVVNTGVPGVTETLWYKKPTSEEAANAANAARQKILEIDTLDQDTLGAVVSVINGDTITSSPGIPWTTRQAVISALGSHSASKIPDEKTGEKKRLEPPEVMAEIGSLLNAFVRAPKDCLVNVSADQLKLIRRKGMELPLPGIVLGQFLEALWTAEGTQDKFRVTFSKETPDA